MPIAIYTWVFSNNKLPAPPMDKMSTNSSKQIRAVRDEIDVVYREITNESIFDSMVAVKNRKVKNPGNNKRNKNGTVLYRQGVQKLDKDIANL
uniref:Uncharacterized protein n=1 Tax=Roseihalotalea indica TaxID=2867963 RepID=A0AA49GH07_9BACT|nr:hypothetical protein K4G66_19430 [Tunicatimonas sp. TK19036]